MHVKNFECTHYIIKNVHILHIKIFIFAHLMHSCTKLCTFYAHDKNVQSNLHNCTLHNCTPSLIAPFNLVPACGFSVNCIPPTSTLCNYFLKQLYNINLHNCTHVTHTLKIKVLYVNLAGLQLLLSSKSTFRMQILSCIQGNCKKLNPIRITKC